MVYFVNTYNLLNKIIKCKNTIYNIRKHISCILESGISRFKILSLILISEPLIISVLKELFEQDVRNVIDMNVVAMPIPVFKNDFILDNVGALERTQSNIQGEEALGSKG